MFVEEFGGNLVDVGVICVLYVAKKRTIPELPYELKRLVSITIHTTDLQPRLLTW